MHTNISIHKIESSQASPLPTNPDTNKKTTLTPLQRSFLQSLLEHFPAVTVFTLPQRGSYSRLGNGTASGGLYSAWGMENREAAVRVTGAPGNHRFEVRPVDGTSNPHLVFAGIIAAGMLGVKEGKELAMDDCNTMASILPDEERKRLGITQALPLSLSEARRLMTADHAMHAALGKEFIDFYLSLNEVRPCGLSAGAMTDLLDAPFR